MKEHEFSGRQQLMRIGNSPALQADERPVYVRDDSTDAAVAEPDAMDGMANEDGYVRALRRSDSHKQVYNPESGRQFDVVSHQYAVVNPPEFIGPLVEELGEREREDVFGTVRVFDGGARVYAEVLFRDTHSIYLPGRGRSDPLRCGFTLRWSHDSGLSINARGFAQDTACKNSMRQIGSSIDVKHAGDVDDRIDWRDEWATVLDELGSFSESLALVVEEAMDFTLFDLNELGPEPERLPSRWTEHTEPLDMFGAVETPGPITEDDRDGLYAFYELLGFPRYLAGEAAERLMNRLAQNDDPRNVTAWDAYSAATWALTHNFRGDVGKSDDDKHRQAKDILMNPAKARQDADAEARKRAAPESEEGLEGVEDPLTADTEDTAGEALRVYSERSRELEQSFGG